MKLFHLHKAQRLLYSLFAIFAYRLLWDNIICKWAQREIFKDSQINWINLIWFVKVKSFGSLSIIISFPNWYDLIFHVNHYVPNSHWSLCNFSMISMSIDEKQSNICNVFANWQNTRLIICVRIKMPLKYATRSMCCCWTMTLLKSRRNDALSDIFIEIAINNAVCTSTYSVGYAIVPFKSWYAAFRLVWS